MVTVMALFVAGSLPRLGVLTRTTVLASIVMAAVALSAGAAHAEWAYMRDARRAGRLNYAPDELRARDVAFFIRHLDDPEPGFAPLAARIAIPMKIQLLPTSERIELRQRWIETLLLAEEVNPEVVVAYRGLPWMWSPRPDVELEDRLIAQLDSDASPWKKGMIRNLVHQGFAHRESTAQALERYAASLDDPDLRLSFDEVVSTLRHRLSLLGTTPYSASP